MTYRQIYSDGAYVRKIILFCGGDNLFVCIRQTFIALFHLFVYY